MVQEVEIATETERGGSAMQRLDLGGETYLFPRLPDVEEGLSLEANLEAVVGADSQDRPAVLFWDARIQGSNAWMRFGRGGIDPILASEHDLSETVAISARAFERLVERGAVKREGGLGRAVALLARSPGLRSQWAPGLIGRVDLSAPPPLSYARQPAISAETLTLAITLADSRASLDPFFAALRGQVLGREIEVVVLLRAEMDPAALKAAAKSVEVAAAADHRIRIRRYTLRGLSPNYLANVAVGLATTEAVVIADASCLPLTANAVQRLADWALSGDAVAACCRIVHEKRLLAAGLAFSGRAGASDHLVPWNELALSEVLRTAAAPAPWFFGVRRSAWIAAGGLRNPTNSPLWTADFASSHGPRGRTILVGAEAVEWIGAERPVELSSNVLAHRNTQRVSTTALRDPVPSTDLIPEVAASPVRPQLGRAQADRGGADHVFCDGFPTNAAVRALVFADRFGASQDIAFVQGMAEARRSGRAAVRILEEKVFPGDSRVLDQADCTSLVEQQFDEVDPTVVIVSRMAHAGAWSAVEGAARRRGVPIVLHLDDDLLHLPATLGIERYRLAQNPMRVRTLREILRVADLVLTATPALERQLRKQAGHARFAALEFGSAGSPAPRRPTAFGPLTVGYMASASHDHDLAMVVPGLNRICAHYPQVEIALFGSIAEQPSAHRLTGRVVRHRPVSGDYPAFKQRLAELRFDVGLAPLRPHPFNRCKTPTKWVEYAEAGAATVVSNIEPYEPMIEAGAAIGVAGDDWETPLRRLIEFPHLRQDLIARADRLLAERFAWSRLEDQVLAALDGAPGPERRAS